MWLGPAAGVVDNQGEIQVSYSKYSCCAVSFLVFLPMILAGQTAPEHAVPLKNWATPLYWQPNQAEREAAGKGGAQLQFSANAVSTDALTFVAITPCRLVDTCGGSAGFNGIFPFSGPSIPPAGTVTFLVQTPYEASANTMPAPCGTIPSIAQAYSFNLTVVPHASGAVDYVTLWPSGSAQPVVATLDDPQGMIVSNAAIVPAGTPYGGISVYNAGPATTDVVIDMNGYFAVPTDEFYNTAVGVATLANNTSGGFNVATGFEALRGNTTGGDNTANGSGALLGNSTGDGNTAIGNSALLNNISGNYNTGVGMYALQNNLTASNNIAIGYYAAANVSDGFSNIHIGSGGTPTDHNTIRIGTPLVQTSFFVAGVNGVTTGNNDAVPVLIDSNGHLGTMISSRRFKEDIEDMGDASSGLLRLRPVTFRYKQPFADGSKPIEYGLIAEEVAEVYPDLVAHSADEQIETVKYQLLDSMLLNELKKQSELIRALEDRLAALEAQR
jgi:hypothetical protein